MTKSPASMSGAPQDRLDSVRPGKYPKSGFQNRSSAFFHRLSYTTSAPPFSDSCKWSTHDS